MIPGLLSQDIGTNGPDITVFPDNSVNSSGPVSRAASILADGLAVSRVRLSSLTRRESIKPGLETRS